MKVGFLGTAHIHTPGFLGHLKEVGIPVVAVYDHDEARAAMNAEKTGARVGSLTDVIHDPEVGALVICSETNRHEQLVGLAAPSGKPLFVEKPIGIDANSAAAMATAIEQGGGLFQTGYRMRGEAAVQTVRRELLAGAFGTVTRARVAVCHSGALGGWFDGEWRWMADRSQAGVGAFGDLGTHGLDLLLWLFGEVDRVTGALSMGTARYAGCDELGEATIVFQSGVIATLTASWDDVACPVRLEVAGTGGHAQLGSELVLWGADGKRREVELAPEVPAGFGAFTAALLGKSGELVSPRAAAYCDRVMEAIYLAAESRSWRELG